MYSEDKIQLQKVGMLLFWSNVGQDFDVASRSDSWWSQECIKSIMCDCGIILFMEAIIDILSYNASRRCSAILKKNS